jgi:hypothetical protein
VKNWHEYDKALHNRGDITLWITPEAIAAWRAPMTDKRGAQPIYADIAIETAIAPCVCFSTCRCAHPKASWARF